MTSDISKKGLWWSDMRGWLASLELEEHYMKFVHHQVTPNEIAFIKEHHLIDMGITAVGDRLRIIDSVETFLRGERNKSRQAIVMRFQNWHCCPCLGCFYPTYTVTESAIIINKPNPFCVCNRLIDNVDITSIQDLSLTVGVVFGTVIVATSDPSVRGGKIKMKLEKTFAKRVHGTIKNLWEEDQLKLGKKGKHDED
jgi:hypothetical protein